MRDEKNVEHISTNAINAGKNFKLFKHILQYAVDNDPSIVNIKFTCPEVKCLEAQLAAQSEVIRELAQAAAELNANVSIEHDIECEARGYIDHKLCTCHVFLASRVLEKHKSIIEAAKKAKG